MRPALPEAVDLVRRIADGDHAALLHLHDLMAGRVLEHVTAEIGDAAAAPAITRAVFLEIWLLAPLAGVRCDDPDAWLAAIAARRSAEHLRTPPRPAGFSSAYDQHIALELAAVLNAAR